MTPTIEAEVKKLSFRQAAAQVSYLGSKYGICSTTNPSSAMPPYWTPIDGDAPGDRAELERRVRVLFAHPDQALHGLHDAHVLKAWAIQNLGSTHDMNRAMREGAAASGVQVDPQDLKFKEPAQ